MNLPAELRNYFKSKAENLPELSHVDAEEQVAFTVDTLSDVLDGVFRSGLKPEGFCMRYVKPGFRGVTDESNGMMTEVSLGFMILKKCGDTVAEIESAQDESLEVMRKVIARIVYDSRNSVTIVADILNQLQKANFNMEEVAFANDGTWAGYLATFSFSIEFIEDIDDLVEHSNWRDL